MNTTCREKVVNFPSITGMSETPREQEIMCTHLHICPGNYSQPAIYSGEEQQVKSNSVSNTMLDASQMYCGDAAAGTASNNGPTLGQL